METDEGNELLANFIAGQESNPLYGLMLHLAAGAEDLTPITDRPPRRNEFLID